jgi:hypothetical protein
LPQRNPFLGAGEAIMHVRAVVTFELSTLRVAAIACALLLLAMPANAMAGSAEVRRRCAPIERQMEKIHSQMRYGYKIRQGEQLRERLRQLGERLDQCRRQRR